MPSSPTPTYQRQERGDPNAYERYLAGMDASMQQKIALTAAHVLGQGWVADMGMGSGTGSDALAALYPCLRVTGVDVNPEMVERAARRYPRSNLDFRVGDIGQPCFEPHSLEAIFNSSVLHHVTSFQGYQPSQAARALECQVAQLRPYGSLIVRDFVRPPEGKVWLDLPESSAVWFRRLAQEFRALQPAEQRGFPYQELPSPRHGWVRFACEHREAVEFLLRKDYQQDWDTEVLEEYTYFTQAEFEQLFHRLGLRILASTPLWNPWIVHHRFEGQCELRDLQGGALGFPPTNYLIVGEKVPPGEGVVFVPGPLTEPQGFLEMTCYRHRQWNVLRDLVRRPHLTVDALPYFEQGGELYVLARKSYPRPLLSLCERRLDGALSPCYVTEPITVLCEEKPLAQTVEEALEAWAGLQSEEILEFAEGSSTYPSPGGVQEEVRCLFVRVQPRMVGSDSARDRVRAIEVGQLLRAAQVGGLPDARLETHCVELLQRLGRSPGPWIGETLRLREQSGPPPARPLAELLQQERRRAFSRCAEPAGFLQLRRQLFRELDAQGRELRQVALEYVVPGPTSLNTLAAVPLWQHQGTIWVGVVDEDLPAAQCFSGHSNHLQAVAWRLPFTVQRLEQVEPFLSSAFQREHGLRPGEAFALGGPYFPSPGVTPEIAYPWAVDVAKWEGGDARLHWVPLEELQTQLGQLKEGHLRVLVSRLWRALAPSS